MNRHPPRQQLARDGAATASVTERGERVWRRSRISPIGVGVFHREQAPGEELCFAEVHLHGGPAPARRFLPELIDLIWRREIDPGKVFDLDLPLEQAAEGYRAMDERRAIKALLRP